MPRQAVEKEITLGGRTLRLVFGLRAVLALQERWGLDTDREVMERFQGIMKASVEQGEQPPLKLGVDMLWAMTRMHHRAEIDWDGCLDLIDGEGIAAVGGVIQSAIQSMMASLQGIEADQGPPASAAA